MRPSLWLATLVACGGTAKPAIDPKPATIANTASCDVSTEAAQHAEYQRLTGHEFVGPDNFYDQTCLSASKTFPGLLTTGSFATEVGCQWSGDEPRDAGETMSWEGVIYDCKFDHHAASIAATAMSRAGWPAADFGKRKQLAWAWVTEVQHAIPIERDPPDHFEPGKHFALPAATPANGGIVLHYWSANPTMGRGYSYSEWTVTFSATGVPAEPVRGAEAYVEIND